MPTFNYFLNIPDGPNNPSNDQPLMKTNTNSTDSIIGVDHFTFETNNRDGLHQQINMFAQASPVRQGDVVEYVNTYQGRNVLFAKNSTDDTPLYFRASNGSTGFTSSYGATITQWGAIAATSGNPSVSFPLTFPNTVFNIQVTRQHSPSSPGATFSFWVDNTTITSSGFTIINNDGHTWSYNWMAIGF